jgi:glyoxylase-like metal-dependent hydrolase (beta-lactamase superfamily II)
VLLFKGQILSRVFLLDNVKFVSLAFLRRLNMENAKWPDALPRSGNQRFQRLESASPWFEVYQVSSNTFALLEPNHVEEVILYLVLGTERAALIDTGMGIGNIQAEVERLTNLPVIVVNTHSHFDHVGDNYRFAEVWAFDDDSGVAYIERGYPHAECEKFMGPDSYINPPVDFDSKTYEVRPSSVTRRLHHLDAIKLGDRTLTVHHTPGHSPDSVCLLDSRDGLLFTGDTFYPGTLFAHFEDSNFEVYLKSLNYLVGLLEQVKHLCPAHNEAYAPREMLVRVLEAFEQIAAGQAAFELQDEIRVYRFEGFGVTLPQT